MPYTEHIAELSYDGTDDLPLSVTEAYTFGQGWCGNTHDIAVSSAVYSDDEGPLQVYYICMRAVGHPGPHERMHDKYALARWYTNSGDQ